MTVTALECTRCGEVMPPDADYYQHWFDVAKIVDNTDDKTRIPTIRIRRIEPLEGPQERSARKIGEAAYSRRTGQKTLPNLDDDAETP